jgi:hypothetical protein
MKKIGDYDPFFDFFRIVGVETNIPVPEAMAIFEREIFFNIGRKETGTL